PRMRMAAATVVRAYELIEFGCESLEGDFILVLSLGWGWIWVCNIDQQKSPHIFRSKRKISRNFARFSEKLIAFKPQDRRSDEHKRSHNSGVLKSINSRYLTVDSIVGSTF